MLGTVDFGRYAYRYFVAGMFALDWRILEQAEGASANRVRRVLVVRHVPLPGA